MLQTRVRLYLYLPSEMMFALGVYAEGMEVRLGSLALHLSAVVCRPIFSHTHTCSPQPFTALSRAAVNGCFWSASQQFSSTLDGLGVYGTGYCCWLIPVGVVLVVGG